MGAARSNAVKMPKSLYFYGIKGQIFCHIALVQAPHPRSNKSLRFKHHPRIFGFLPLGAVAKEAAITEFQQSSKSFTSDENSEMKWGNMTIPELNMPFEFFFQNTTLFGFFTRASRSVSHHVTSDAFRPNAQPQLESFF